MAVARPNPVVWSGSTDDEGHRTYKVRWLVDTNVAEGPASVLEATGLPVVGSQWNFGGDSDLWAWCLPAMQASPTVSGEACNLWTVDQTFSTKPPAVQRCADQKIDDPLLIPPEISGDFKNYTEEATEDRFGFKITNSAWEAIRGPKVEFDHNRQSVKIKMNFAMLNLPFVTAMIDTVNAFPIWGFPARCVKLSKATWDRKFYGSCYVYYSYTFEFDVSINQDGTSGFDRNLDDEGTKVLHGHWGHWSGTGCTVALVATNGVLVDVTAIAAAGSNYPADQVITLKVTGGGSTTPGMLKATVNAAGQVVDATILRGGGGYSSGILATATAEQGWVLDYIEGAPPVNTDPSHFDHYIDKNGNPTKVRLNGAGLPAEQVLMGGDEGTDVQQYMSTCPSIGSDPPSTNWVLLGSGPAVWSAQVTYQPGDSVLADPNRTLYVCVAASTPGLEPSLALAFACPAPGDQWIAVPAFASQGEYDSNKGYTFGDVVTVTTGPTAPDTGAAGSIFVQFYTESDFLLLGIPASLE